MENFDVDTTRYYNTLGVTKDANLEQIRTNFRRLISVHQPEMGGDRDLFNLIKEAYNVLKDPEKRRLYDMYGETLAPQSSDDLSGFDNNMFNMFGNNPAFAANNSAPQSNNNPPQSNNNPPGPSQNNNNPGSELSPQISVNLDVTLEEVFNGWTKPVTYERIGNASQQTWQICNGTGTVRTTSELSPGMVQQYTNPWNDCNQTGLANAAKENATLQVLIPKGIKDSEKIVFEGQGNRYPNMQPGKVMVVIKVQNDHPTFQRKGADLIIDKEITFMQALAGVNFTFTHLNGRTVRVTNKMGDVIKQGSKMTLLNYGMPFYQDANKFGNLFIEFKIAWPEKLTPSQVMGLRNLFGNEYRGNEEAKANETAELVDYKPEQVHDREEGTSYEPPPFNDTSEDDGEGVQCRNQ